MQQEVVRANAGSPNGKTLATWLQGICDKNGLSLREAGEKAELSHTTIADIINGQRPSADTIKKLAAAFGGNGPNQRASLEDLLLTLSGYRSNPEGVMSEPLARLLDQISLFNEEQLKIMGRFADFISRIGH